MMTNFPCTQCGACCCNVSKVSDLKHTNGVCHDYDSAQRKCRIYNTRPTVCRIDEGRPVMFTASDWTALNLIACDSLHLKMYGQPREQSGICSHSKE
jgi:hypothetical protein